MNNYSWEYHFIGSACHLQTHQPAASERCVTTACFYGTNWGHRWVQIDCCRGLDILLSSAESSNVVIIMDSCLTAVLPSNTPTSRVGELCRHSMLLWYLLGPSMGSD